MPPRELPPRPLPGLPPRLWPPPPLLPLRGGRRLRLQSPQYTGRSDVGSNGSSSIAFPQSAHFKPRWRTSTILRSPKLIRSPFATPSIKHELPKAESAWTNGTSISMRKKRHITEERERDPPSHFARRRPPLIPSRVLPFCSQVPCRNHDPSVRSSGFFECGPEFAYQLGDKLLDADDLVDPMCVLTAEDEPVVDVSAIGV